MTDQTTYAAEFFSVEMHLLNLLAWSSERRVAADLERQFGLTLLEGRIVATIAYAEAIPFKQLVAQAQFDKSHVSRVVAGLAKKGFILSEADPEDQRAAIVRLTDEGLRLFVSLNDIIARNNELWLSSLSKTRRAAFKATLLKLVELNSERSLIPALPPALARQRRNSSSAGRQSPPTGAHHHPTPAS